MRGNGLSRVFHMPSRSGETSVAGRAASQPLVAVIVLNWNGKQDTLGCLRSLERNTYTPVRIYVVDNGSSDGSLEEFRRAFPPSDRLFYLVNESNLGYAGGNNRGIVRALEDGADYVLILNNDTVVDSDMLETLVGVARREPSVGILGPKVLCEPARHLLYSAGERQSLWFNRRRIAVGRPDPGDVVEPRDVDYVVGCAMLVSQEFIEQVGLLDETFFAYYDEVDWCFRGRRAGYRVMVVPAAVVYHKGEASSGKGLNPITAYCRTRNWIYFMRKHAAFYHWPSFVPVFAAVFLSRVGAALLRADSAVLGSLFRALWWQVRPHSAWGALSPSVMRRPPATNSMAQHTPLAGGTPSTPRHRGGQIDA